MSSGIEWTDETWNPLAGCAYVSDGCRGCYAARDAAGRLSSNPIYAGLTERSHGLPRFTGEVRLLPERLDQPLRWQRPRRVFVNSMSDLFHPEVPRSFVAEVFAVMHEADHHQFQVLTKRPQRMAGLVADERFRHTVAALVRERRQAAGHSPTQEVGWPLSNVWLGTSVENQRYADLRVPHLLATPAAVRFLSIEPLLGPVDLSEWIEPVLQGQVFETSKAVGDGVIAYVPTRFKIGLRRPEPSIDWVIVGGESGPQARPMHPDWARAVRDQCQAAGVPFLFKQWGEYLPVPVEDDPNMAGGRAYSPPGGGRSAVQLRERRPGRPVWRAMEPGDATRAGVLLDRDTFALRLGKKAAGRELDGRTWDEYPA